MSRYTRKRGSPQKENPGQQTKKFAMKRKNPPSVEQADETAAAAASQLTVLSDEISVAILSHLSFCERPAVRCVSHRLKSLVETLPPPENLQIELVERLMTKWNVSCDSSVVKVQLRNWNDDHPTTMMLSRSLRSVCPRRLKVDASQSVVVDAGHLRRLIHAFSASCSTSDTAIAVERITAPSAMALLEEFSRFDGGCRVTKIQLGSTMPLDFIVQAASFLRSLVQLRLVLRDEMFPNLQELRGGRLQAVGLQLGALSSLPCLKQLSIELAKDALEAEDESYLCSEMVTDDAFVSGFTLGCAAIPNLQFISTDLLLEWSWSTDTSRALVLMLRRLVNLQELSLLYYPKSYLWTQVHAAGGHSSLKKIAIYYSEPTEDDLQSLVEACLRDFPALQELELHFVNDECNCNQAVGALSGLQAHPNLAILSCGIDPHHPWVTLEANRFFPTLREGLGEGIRVVEIDHYDSMR